MKKEVEIKERRSGALFMRDVSLPLAGESLPGHAHRYEHTMMFMSGKAKVTVKRLGKEDEASEIQAPADMVVEAGAIHAIEALTDDVFFTCVFVHRDGDGKITQEPNHMGAYY